MGYLTEWTAIVVASIVTLLLLLCIGGCTKVTEGFNILHPSGTDLHNANQFYIKLSGGNGQKIAVLHCSPDDNTSQQTFMQAVLNPSIQNAGIRGFIVAQSHTVQRPWIKQVPAVAYFDGNGNSYVDYTVSSSSSIQQFILSPPPTSLLK